MDPATPDELNALAGFKSIFQLFRSAGPVASSGSVTLDDSPHAGELFGTDQLARHAQHVAESHTVGEAAGPELLLPKLRDDDRVIRETCKLLSDALARNLRLVPAAEWLLDNAYLIEEQIVLARQHLPRDYSLELPHLLQGPRAGIPRVYDIAVELISHTDGRFDENDLSHFLAAYQQVTVLRLGELWAVPIMVRLALVNSIRHVAHRLARNRRQRDLACRWARRFIDLARNDPKKLIVALADLVTANLPLTRPFVSELTIRLQGQHPSLGLVIQWLEHELADQGRGIEQVLHSESQAAASDQASIANSITGLRSVSSVDWAKFVETHSAVHAALRDDPAAVYAQMDFHTRDAYRHVIEHLRRRCDHTEQRIAEHAIMLARQAREINADDPRLSHVGYYLIGDGRVRLENHIGYHPTWGERFRRSCKRHPAPLYTGSIALLSLLLAAPIICWAVAAGTPAWMLIVVAAPLLPLVTQCAVSLANRLATTVIPPRILPRMDYFDAVPDERRTVVAVPTLLTSREQARELADALEVRYLGNRDPAFSFALLTDFPDAPAETQPGDDALLAEALDAVRRLNDKYARAGSPFFLLHRPRRWNKAEGVWMGRERKRGKVTDFNRLLARDDRTPFSVIEGNPARLRDTRYVIVLDSDTQLPPQSAWKLVGTLAHPLNEAHIDADRRIVDRGYGLLQPRVSHSLTGTSRSRYARLFSGDTGIDPYTRAVSNLYQDLFNEASFIGKGIFDVRAFDACLADRFPDNTILSHDLLEGCYTRCGFVSDVELIEDHPARYTADMARHHRWVRGDWQIIRWCFARLPGRWRIADNLRRSTLPIAAVALFAVAWLVMSRPLCWTLIALTLILLPVAWNAFAALLRKPEHSRWPLHLRCESQKQLLQLSQIALRLVFLPFEAANHLDAIAKTCWRKLISHRHLLQWRTADDADRSAAVSLTGVTLAMSVAPAFAVALAIAVVQFRPAALPVALPLLVAWFFSPLAAWWLSRPLHAEQFHFARRDVRFLRQLARRTWHFYERFVTDQSHWLPPDNYQQRPIAHLATHTSPTNIGMAALCNLAALDFGYISSAALLERTGKMFDTLDQLDRHRGHFHNWYDIQTLQPLPPRLISTVDSGNLSVWLIVLAQGLRDLPHQPLLPPEWFPGLRDTAQILLDEIHAASPKPSRITPGSSTPRPGESFFRGPGANAALGSSGSSLVNLLANLLHVSPPANLADTRTFLDHLHAALSAAAPQTAVSVSVSGGGGDSEVHTWFHALVRQCDQLRDELSRFIPWPVPTEADLASLARALASADVDPSHVNELLHDLRHIPTLHAWSQFHHRHAAILARLGRDDSLAWVRTIADQSQPASDRARHRIDALSQLQLRCRDLAAADYQFLFDPRLKLFSIGYHTDRRQLDPGHYDLLATEPRLASYIAIAQNQVPLEHWFQLRRTLTPVGRSAALVSWSGSMFEYLMPLLVMPTFRSTLLDETCRAAVAAHIEHGRAFNIPWGVSESGYNLVDAHFNYQYRAFGVPALGLNRGLTDDLVIAPYAAALAIMVRPDAAVRNLRAMSELGFVGPCGLYEAVDYSPRRLPEGRSHAIVESFMAHHVGMTLLSLTCALLDRPMQRRFVAEPEFRSALLLLQERVPNVEPTLSTLELQSKESETRHSPADTRPAMRIHTNPSTLAPEIALLGNGRYSVMLSSAGGGYSRWNDLTLTRWRADRTQDHFGQFCYLRDLDRRNVWSVAHQPLCKPADNYQAVFSQGRVEYIRADDQIETHTQISVSPEDDVEVRVVKVRNLSRATRRIELTTYGEVVLAHPAADAAHRAFSNLFIESQLLPDAGAILFSRRPRAADETPPFMFHLTTGDTTWSAPSYETDRAAFVGRNRTPRDPLAMTRPGPLTNSAGAVIDPVMSIRRVVALEPGQQAELLIVTGVAATRDAAESLIAKYADRRLGERAYETAWTHNQAILQQIGASASDALLFNQLAASLVYPDATFRAAASVIARNRQSQAGLWAQSISGDLPVILLTLRGDSGMELLAKTAQAHIWWRIKGLRADLVVIVDDRSEHRQPFIDRILGHLASTAEATYIDKPAGVFVRGIDRISENEYALLQAVTMLTLSDRAGNLADQADRTPRTRAVVPPLNTTDTPGDDAPGDLPSRDLLFFNGTGGFTHDGKEYVVRLQPGRSTPAPWANVIANATFGTIVSDSGSAYTWAENAHEFRLSTWHNDPLADATGEAFYIRDEQSGRFWSPSPLPARGQGPYLCRHGLGYTIHEHDEAGIFSQAATYVATDAPIKFVAVKLRNHSGRPRRLSVTHYVEWVLGEQREKTAMHIVTRLDPRTGAILASNAYHLEFDTRVAFAHCHSASGGGERTFTADRTEFIGRNGCLADPQAMRRRHLSNRIGAALDPCAALQSVVEIPDGEERQIVFMLGAGRSETEALELLQRFRGADAARQSLEAVWHQWNRLLGAVYVETPDPALNVLLNYWTMYQAIACRLWGRSGYYQSGGAFGFRDQLQDAMAMLHNAPWLLREQLVRCAGRQFREGDVQHWWHTPFGRGVRTQFSDDYLWLPYAACRYVLGTGDTGLLDETIPFLESRPLRDDEESNYELPKIADQSSPFYEHCLRAIRRGVRRLGSHGLPLMGCGDWNDGMNKVGEHGRGESVWLAFFLYDILTQFTRIAAIRNDDAVVAECESAAESLQAAIEKHGWDGEWYRRAYFDDGTPLGTAANDECQIDSLSQSWAVISGAAPEQRAGQAMQSLEKRLVRDDLKLIQLLDPPFDKTPMNPGYIKGYIPGVRENGGQYTHAAVWAAIAFAMRGDADRAWQCFRYITPIAHTRTADDIATYKVEPYVIAADIYTNPRHAGRGGWTWYTGAAGWTFRLMFETLLGVRLEIDKLTFAPLLPADWKEYRIHYRFRETMYHLTFKITGPNSRKVRQIKVDGEVQSDLVVHLTDDRTDHHAEVELG
ncbi:MAG: GH36-type glycosyl hydrolase domain-containing protein [Phycisphaerales bacterium]